MIGSKEMPPRAIPNALLTTYDKDIDKIREEQYPMLKDAIYLDHAGTTLYAKSAIDAFSQDLLSNVFGNPHSASLSSQISTRRIEDTRLKALHFFKADPVHFDLVFVANATAAIKLVIDSFRDHERGFWYGYHKDSHTSLIGAREAAKAGQRCFTSDVEVESWLDGRKTDTFRQDGETLGLFAYPAQSNMNGKRFPMSWTQRVKSRGSGRRMYCLLDAAALASTSPLDLSDATRAPDFTALSFNKIFGFPDLGALIVRKSSGAPLRTRNYFGGGTVEIVTCGQENWHVKKEISLHDQLEDGTLPIHSIVALDKAMDVHRELFRSQERVALHTSKLADRLYSKLIALRHCNGKPVCQVYNDTGASFADLKSQGPIIALNLRNSRGDFISNAEVEKLANIRNIHIRTGGLCNPGGVASSLDLAPWELSRNFSAGHRCGNDNDIILGKPTGMIRVSLGAMSNAEDVDSFVRFVEEFFVDKEAGHLQQGETAPPPGDTYIESLTIYPVKSCAGWRIPSCMEWDVRSEGLAWDREWCLVHQGTRKALSQKKYPRMALLRPSLDLKKGGMCIDFYGSSSPGILGGISVPLSADPSLYDGIDDGLPTPTSEVCGDAVLMKTYASRDIAKFLTDAVGTPCTLARFPPSDMTQSARHAKLHLSGTSLQKPLLLSNESPILVISRSSLNRLNEQIKGMKGKTAHASVFRANIVLAEDPQKHPGFERPYAEDRWQSLLIGAATRLDILGGCRRCQIVCIDQTTGEKNEEPFVTLAKTRRRQGKVYFGVHASLHQGSIGPGAKIKAGHPVRPVLEEENAHD